MVTEKATAHILYVGNQIELMSPFNAEFVSELKSGLKSRRWNQAKKKWTVDIKERQKLIEIASRFFQIVEENRPKDIDVSAPGYDAEPVEAPSGVEIASLLRPGAELRIWTDGACDGNPGPGGYGIVFECQGYKWEKAGGFRLTTNNRMEIIGALVALDTLPEKCRATIYSDSRYLVDSVMKGWARQWRSKGWKMKGDKKRPNADLWERLLQLLEKHEVEFRWVKGHGNSVENDRCDRLAESFARKDGLPVDESYEGADLDTLDGL